MAMTNLVAALAAALISLTLTNCLVADDSGRDGDDPEAKQHDDYRQQSSQQSLGYIVAVADGGHGDHSPVDPVADALELAVGV